MNSKSKKMIISVVILSSILLTLTVVFEGSYAVDYKEEANTDATSTETSSFFFKDESFTREVGEEVEKAKSNSDDISTKQSNGTSSSVINETESSVMEKDINEEAHLDNINKESFSHPVIGDRLIITDNGNFIEGNSSLLVNAILLAPLDNKPMPYSIQGTLSKVGSKVTFKNGGVYLDKRVDIVMETVQIGGKNLPKNVGVQYNSYKGVYIQNESTDSNISFKITAVLSGTNISIDSPILIPLNYHGYKILSLSNKNLLGFVISETERDKINIIKDTDDLVGFVQNELGSPNFYEGIKGNFVINNGSIVKYTNQSVAGSMGWFTLTGPLEVKFPYKKPEIEGFEDKQLAKYIITQTLRKQYNTKYYPENLEIDIDLDNKIFDLEHLDLTSINVIDVLTNSKLEPTNILKIDTGIKIVFSKSILESISYSQNVAIHLGIPITSNYKNLEPYFKEESWYLPVTVRNNQTSEESKADAMINYDIYGEPIPQVVKLDTDTDSLVMEDLVEGYSPIPEEVVCVREMKDFKVFNSLGDTTVDVVIEGSMTKKQKTISIPIKVIDGKLELLSVPKSIKFGSQTISKTKTNFIPKIEGKLIVSDDRARKGPWRLTLKEDKPLSSSSNSLEGLIYYTNENGVVNISKNVAVIEKQKHLENKEIVISDEWNDKRGFKLKVPVEKQINGNYEGRLSWTLEIVPNN